MTEFVGHGWREGDKGDDEGSEGGEGGVDDGVDGKHSQRGEMSLVKAELFSLRAEMGPGLGPRLTLSLT